MNEWMNEWMYAIVKAVAQLIWFTIYFWWYFPERHSILQTLFFSNFVELHTLIEENDTFFKTYTIIVKMWFEHDIVGQEHQADVGVDK